MAPLLSVIVKLVGFDLVNNYFPLSEKGYRAENPVIVFGLSVFFIVLLDFVSLKIFDSIDAERVSELQQKMRDLYEQGKPLEGNEQTNMAIKQIEKTVFNKGIVQQCVNHPIVKSFVELFRRK